VIRAPEVGSVSYALSIAVYSPRNSSRFDRSFTYSSQPQTSHRTPLSCAGQHRQVHRWGISSKTGYFPVTGRKASVGEPAGTGKYRCTVSL
jgi:hypothetical protein